MKIDGIQLLGASTADNFTIVNGPELPETGNNVGELFYLTTGDIGLYIYHSDGWALIDSGPEGPGAAAVWGNITGTLQDQLDLWAALQAKAPIDSPTFTGTVSGITKAMVGLASVDNTADIDKIVSTPVQTALNLKADKNNPTFTGTVSGITKTMVGLDQVDNTSDANKQVSILQQAALDLKADKNNPTFTGTVSGITKAMVGLGNVDNTADSAKPISTLQQAGLDLKVNRAGDTMTGNLTISPTSGVSTLTLNRFNNTVGSRITHQTGGITHWTVGPPGTANDWSISRYNVSTGAFVDHPMIVNLTDGKTNFYQSITINSNVGGGAVMSVNTTGTNGAAYAWQKSGIARWSLNIGTTETGSNTGSDLIMYRFDDAGNSIGIPLTINRSTGATTIGGSLSVLNNSLVVASQAGGTAAVSSFQVPSPGPFDGQVGQVNFCDMGNTGGGGVEKRLAGIVAFRDVAADTTAGGRLEFWTRANNAANWTSRMQISNAGTVTIPGQLLTRYIRETMTVPTGATGTVAVDPATNGSILNYVLTGNTTFTFPSGTGWSGVSFTLIIKQDATSRTVTWPSTVRWPNGGTNSAFVVIPTTVNLSHVYSFLYDGSFWLGSVGGANYTR